MTLCRLPILGLLLLVAVIAMSNTECGAPTSDDIQQAQQEKILKEGTSQIGMPAIKNFRRRKLMKDIIELCDQNGLVTYTYLENLTPTIVHGHTALGGKLTFLGETISYPIPCATQFTNPEKKENGYREETPLPQADPDGLFSPSSAEGSWVLMLDPVKKQAMPVYTEPRVVTLTYKLPMD